MTVLLPWGEVTGPQALESELLRHDLKEAEKHRLADFTPKLKCVVVAVSKLSSAPQEFVASPATALALIHSDLTKYAAPEGPRMRIPSARDFLDQIQRHKDEAIFRDEWIRENARLSARAHQSATTEQNKQAAGEPLESGTDRGRRVKRAALIANNLRRWPTIERDLKDAAANGLSEAARDLEANGWWWEGSALEWARSRSKVQEASQSWDGLPSFVHRAKG